MGDDELKFLINGEISHNDVQVMAQVFFHHLPFVVVDEVCADGLCLAVEKNSCSAVTARLFDKGNEILAETSAPQAASEREARPVAYAIYQVLSKFTGYIPPWGLLTGIRPAKLFTALFGEGMNRLQAINEIVEQYFVQPERAELCADVAARQVKLMATSAAGAISIYISIAFCPTRCNYCSFSAYPITKFGNREEAYVSALIREVTYLGKISKGKQIENIYIGGGTPTALNDKNFEKLLSAVQDNFDTQSVLEYTVEAGRPDTISREKLEIMRKYAVQRVSVNPQTLNDKTLEKIGRSHTVSDFFEAYKLTREYGFSHINIDLILGLEGEDAEDVKRTLAGIAALEPESVTIHSLAVKRASKLHYDAVICAFEQVGMQEDMLELCNTYMSQAGLAPYYLYRQKNSPGNFENIGYSKPGMEGRYNIHMMEETRSVLAAGCGAITKLVCEKTGKIDRIMNIRDLDQYIARVDEMIVRKGDIYE